MEKPISKLRFSEKESGRRSFLTRTDCPDDFPIFDICRIILSIVSCYVRVLIFNCKNVRNRLHKERLRMIEGGTYSVSVVGNMHTKRVCPSYEIVTGPIHRDEVALERPHVIFLHSKTQSRRSWKPIICSKTSSVSVRAGIGLFWPRKYRYIIFSGS